MKENRSKDTEENSISIECNDLAHRVSVDNDNSSFRISKSVITGDPLLEAEILESRDTAEDILLQDKCLNGEVNEVQAEMERTPPLHYSVSESPPPYLLVLFALQQALLCVSAPVSVTLVVAEVVCAQKDEAIKAHIISASMLMCGVATFLMSTFGVRLPIFQGPSSIYLVPLLVMSTSSEWQCPKIYEDVSAPENTTILLAEIGNDTVVPARELIITKISQLSGSLIFVGIFHFLIGAFGLAGIIIRFIGPVTIVPAIVLVGLYLFKVIVKFCRPSWLVASVTSTLNLILSLFLANKKTPIPFWSSAKGFHIVWFPLHQMFSVMISLLVGWGLSAVLTVSGFYTDDSTSEEYLARTDAKGDIISKVSFFDFPYPGKFAGLSFSSAGLLSFFIATLMSVLDSVGDYNACAKIVGVPSVPKFAFNRGIAVEGLATIACGSLGCCHATLSFGQNVGAIGSTRVASRRVFQVCGVIYILCAVVGKFGAVFLTIPLPVLGGTMLVMIGLFIGVCISYLEAINLRSTRNIAIIGIGLLLGLMLPYWTTTNPDKINTGIDELDALIKILLSNPAFVGGFFACVMDNSVPGTLKERGLLEQMKELDMNPNDPLTKKAESIYIEGQEVYRLPFLPEALRRSRVAKIFPVFDSTLT